MLSGLFTGQVVTTSRADEVVLLSEERCLQNPCVADERAFDRRSAKDDALLVIAALQSIKINDR